LNGYVSNVGEENGAGRAKRENRYDWGAGNKSPPIRVLGRMAGSSLNGVEGVGKKIQSKQNG